MEHEACLVIRTDSAWAFRRAHGRCRADPLVTSTTVCGMCSTTSTLQASPARTSPSSTASVWRGTDEFAAGSQQRAEARDRSRGLQLRTAADRRLCSACRPSGPYSDEAPRAGDDCRHAGAPYTAFRGERGTGDIVGSASGINDGPSAIVVMSALGERGAACGGLGDGRAQRTCPLGRRGETRDDGERLGLCFAEGAGQAGLELGDIDLFELNQAFAAQSLAPLRELDISSPNGSTPVAGAIALGYREILTGARSGGRTPTDLQSDEMAPPQRGTADLPRSASAAGEDRPRSSGPAPGSERRRTNLCGRTRVSFTSAGRARQIGTLQSDGRQILSGRALASLREVTAISA